MSQPGDISQIMSLTAQEFVKEVMSTMSVVEKMEIIVGLMIWTSSQKARYTFYVCLEVWNFHNRDQCWAYEMVLSYQETSLVTLWQITSGTFILERSISS